MAGPLSDPAPAPSGLAQGDGVGIPRERANILVVDDRPDKHVVYKAVLEELDQNLIHVHSGEEALKQVLQPLIFAPPRHPIRFPPDADYGAVLA